MQACGVHGPVDAFELPFVAVGKADRVDGVEVLSEDEVGAHVDLGRTFDFTDVLWIGLDCQMQVDERIAAARGDEHMVVVS